MYTTCFAQALNCLHNKKKASRLLNLITAVTKSWLTFWNILVLKLCKHQN